MWRRVLVCTYVLLGGGPSLPGVPRPSSIWAPENTDTEENNVGIIAKYKMKHKCERGALICGYVHVLDVIHM